MPTTGIFMINGHDYTSFIKQKTGLGWGRDNTNDEDAGRDSADEMHTNVRSHQRQLTLKLGPMSFDMAMQLEHDLQDNDAGVTVTYPDLYDGICTRLFYNTSITAAEEQFIGGDIRIDNINFTLISVKEATL